MHTKLALILKAMHSIDDILKQSPCHTATIIRAERRVCTGGATCFVLPIPVMEMQQMSSGLSNASNVVEQEL